MTAKKKEGITEKGVLEGDMHQLMTPQAIEELKGLTPTMQQFLLRWQDKRDLILSEQLKDELKVFMKELYEEDNERLCKSVAEVVAKQLSETLTPIYLKLQELADGQEKMAEDISAIKLEQQRAKDEARSIHDEIECQKKDIDILKKNVAILQPDSIESIRKEMHELIPLLRKSTKVNSPFNIVLRIAIGIILGIVFMWFIFKYWWVKLF